MHRETFSLFSMLGLGLGWMDEHVSEGVTAAVPQ